MPSTNPKPSNGTNQVLSVHRSSAWDSSSEDESRDENTDDFDNMQKHGGPMN